MEEKEYIQLNDLLTKYRVTILKELGGNNVSSTRGNDMVRQLRCIDKLRNGMILIFNKEDENIESISDT